MNWEPENIKYAGVTITNKPDNLQFYCEFNGKKFQCYNREWTIFVKNKYSDIYDSEKNLITIPDIETYEKIKTDYYNFFGYELKHS